MKQAARTVLPMRISQLSWPAHLHLCQDAGTRTVGSRLLIEGVWLLRTKLCAGPLNHVIRTPAGLERRKSHLQ